MGKEIKKRIEEAEVEEEETIRNSITKDTIDSSTSMNNDTNFSSLVSLFLFFVSKNNNATKKKIFAYLSSFLKHYNKFIGNDASNQDKGLKLMQRNLWLLSKLSGKKSGAYKKASSNISFARYILRFYGLPSSIEALLNGSWEDTSIKNGGSITGRIMSLSMIIFYPLEHLAYIRWTSPDLFPVKCKNKNSLSASAVTKGTLASADRISAYSCRFWLLYIMADLLQAILKLRSLHQKRMELLSSSTSKDATIANTTTTTTNNDDDKNSNDDDDDDENLLELRQLQHSIVNQQLRGIRSLLYAFPCISWSLPPDTTSPWALSENYVGSLLYVESFLSMYQALRSYYYTEVVSS